MYVPLKCTVMALGFSRCLYANRIQTGQYGALLAPISGLKDVAKQIAASKFQLNTHAIGDSANTVILKIYEMFWLNQR
jgi:predicted amidohydrolase YtcJ